jgi:Domain of unknown function (DUF4082)/Siphovirus-type tail component, C-terminal domain
MSYPPEWPNPGKLHFRLLNERLGRLDLNCDSGYIVTAFDLGFPEIREVKMNNSLDDGVFDVTRFFGARSVSLDVTLKSHTGLTPASNYIASEAVLRDKLLGYLYPGIRSTMLFSEHGDPRVRQILIRGTSASVAVSQKDYNRVNLSWLAPRGTLYAYDERCYMFRFGETSGDFMELIIVNEGTIDVDWRATISGWSIHPRFILNGKETLRLEYDADPGDVVTLDSFSRTLTINGAPASYAYIGDNTVWFKIPPGQSTLRVEHLSGLSAYGYPYARWQETGVAAGFTDTFARADGDLGSDWETPTVIPADTAAVDLAIDAGAVIVTEPDDPGTPDREWGFARYVTELTSATGIGVEMEVSNLGQSSVQGPLMRSKVELFTNMNDTNAACQALSVDFDYGIPTTPAPPVVRQDPFETLDQWTIVGTDALLVPGRNGQGLQLAGLTTSLTYNLPLEAQSGIVIAGIAFKITAGTGVTTISNNRQLLELRSAGQLVGSVGVAVGGSLFATDRLGANKGGSAAGTVKPNTWHYAEVRYVAAKTTGEFALRLDGIDAAGAYDIDTNAVTGTVDQIVLPTPNTVSGGTHTYDDLYVAIGTEATFIGPLNVPNGSLAWELHQYDAGGVSVNSVGSGALPYNYTGTTLVRLESVSDGAQRFLLDGDPITELTDETPVVGTLVGFGASYETFEYESEAGDVFDDFERAALGTNWVLPVARTSDDTTILPTISTGAAITTAHTTAAPQQVYTATTTGGTLTGGIAQTMPQFVYAGYLVIARVLQENPGGVHTASPGWTTLGTVTQGTPGGDFMEAFDNFGAWFTSGTAAIVAGRTGNAARVTGVSTTNRIDFGLRTENATVIVGFAHQISSLAAATSEICQFYSDANVTQHNRLTVATNGSLSFWRGTTNLATSAAGVIAINTWNYIEVRTVLSDTVGAFEVRVNGTAVIGPLTAQDTQNAGTKTVYDSVRLSGPIASQFNTFDDCYIVTGGSAAFKGNQTIAVSSGIEFLRMTAFARLADGTSNDALTITGTAGGAPVGAGQFVTHIESYWLQPDGYAGTDIISQLKFAAASGASGGADPPVINLGGAKDWRFLVSAGLDVQSSPSMTPSAGYSSFTGPSNSPGTLCSLHSASRTASVGGTENPAAYTGSSAGRPWCAMTIGIPGSGFKWAAAEHITEFNADATITAEAVVYTSAGGGAPLVEIYTHMVHGSPTCRVLQAEIVGRTWKMGHYVEGTGLVVAASGAFPTGFGAEQHVTTPGVPNAVYTGEIGTEVRFGRAGQITKIRYYRTAATPSTVTLNIWNSAGTRIAGPITDTTGAGTDGWQTVTLVTPIASSGNQNYTGSYSAAGVGVPMKAGLSVQVPATTDITVVAGSVYNATAGSRPVIQPPEPGQPYVELVYVPDISSAPWRMRLESDPDGTERFLFDGTLVQSILDVGAPKPTVATRVGFGEFWTTATSSSPQVREFTATGSLDIVGPPPPEPTSPRIELFTAKPLRGTDWALPDRTVALTDPTRPRPNAPRINEDYWSVLTGVPSPPSPGGAALVNYNGAGSGLFVYADGWTYDGYGWRDEVGHDAYPDGAVVPAVSNTPPNNPPPGGRPPWAWTPPVDPLTGEPSILTVHFCFFDQWL